jgi:hypothetical protein
MDAKVERIGYWIYQQLKRHDPAEWSFLDTSLQRDDIHKHGGSTLTYKRCRDKKTQQEG